MALELRLAERKWTYALALGLVFGVALAGAVHYAWFRGLNAEIDARRHELEGLQKEIQEGRAAERKLAQFREEVKRLELDLARLLQILPSKRNTEDLIKRIEALTHQGDFTLKKFTPGEFVAKELSLELSAGRKVVFSYSEWPIDIQLEGTYHNLALFFDRMSRFSRIINVEEMKIAGINDPSGKSIAANFTAKTFIHTAEEKGEAGKKAATPKPAGPGAVGKAQTLKKKSEAGMSE